MTDEPQAAWIWPRRDRITGRVRFTPESRRTIGALTVGWNSGESGAAALASRDFQLLEDLDEESLKLPLSLFMSRAILHPFRGTIRNPFAGTTVSDEAAYLIADIPNSSMISLLRGGEDISFQASAEDLKLWEAASRDWRGIDPKRPFGSESVSRDVRALIDPDKKLSNTTFSKQRKLAEARLVLMLLLFVQAAELKAGDYERDHLFNWLPAGSVSLEPELIAAAAWAGRVAGELFYKLDDANRTLAALRHLADDGRVGGAYATLATQFRLWEIFERDWHATYDGGPADYLDTGLRYFTEVTANAETSPLTLMRVRLHNFSGEFGKASALLNSAKLASQELPKTSEISLPALAAIEALIVRHGTGTIDGKAFDASLNARYGGGQGYCLRDWARELLEGDKDETSDAYIWRLMQSAAAQLLFMSALVH